MPWYMFPTRTCQVMNRLARKYSSASLEDLRQALDNATELLWHKVENFYAHHSN